MCKTRIVVVLGMHRSGTSLAARVLQGFGVDLGKDLLPAGEDNPDGYFENAQFSNITTRILKTARRSLPLRTGVLPMPDLWWTEPAYRDDVNELRDNLAREVASATGLWGFKDPRTLILLPMWQTLFEELNIEPRYVLCLRHPGAVAQSLRARDGLSLLQGETLWLRYLTDGIVHCKGNFDVIVRFEDWFTEPESTAERLLKKLFAKQAFDQLDITSALADKIRPELLHQVPVAYEFRLPIAETLYGELAREDYDKRVRQRVYNLAKRFSEVQRNLAFWAQSLDANLRYGEKLRKEIRDLEDWAKGREKERESSLQRLSQIEAEREKLTKELAELQDASQRELAAVEAARHAESALHDAEREKLTRALAELQDASQRELAAVEAARHAESALHDAEREKLTRALAELQDTSQRELGREAATNQELLSQLAQARAALTDIADFTVSARRIHEASAARLAEVHEVISQAAAVLLFVRRRRRFHRSAPRWRLVASSARRLVKRLSAPAEG